MITTAKYFVHPSESNLQIDSSNNVIDIILPTAEAINAYNSTVGAIVPTVIGYSINGATINSVKFYRGGGLFWNNSLEYIEIKTDGDGTISTQDGIQAIGQSTQPNSGSGLSTESGTFTRLAKDGSGSFLVATNSKAKMIFISAKSVSSKSVFSDGKSNGVINNCVSDGKSLISIDFNNSLLIDNGGGYSGSITTILDNGFIIDFVKLFSGDDINVQWIAMK